MNLSTRAFEIVLYLALNIRATEKLKPGNLSETWTTECTLHRVTARLYRIWHLLYTTHKSNIYHTDTSWSAFHRSEPKKEQSKQWLDHRKIYFYSSKNSWIMSKKSER